MAEPEVEEYCRQNNANEAFFKRHGLVLSDLTGHLIFWPLMLGGLALDLWSKQAVFQWLKPYDRISIIDGFLWLVAATNEGAAFGIAAGRRYLLVGISAAAIVVIIGVFLITSGRQRIVQMALGLFGAGVCGNLWDRVFNDGSVRDFIDVVYWPGRHWPSFNIADSMLCIAVGLLILATLTDRRSCQKHAQQQK